MKYIYGKILKTQSNLYHCIKMEYMNYDILPKITEWCNLHYGKVSYSSFHLTRHWYFRQGTKFCYFFFKTKEDAMLFKISWIDLI